jgi:hypothetical protein
MDLQRTAAVICLLLIYSTHSFGREKIGVVLKLRGEVTQLRPGEKLARKVSLDEELLEDTSVVTGSKSMVIIRMTDMSTLTLGPESKMVLVESGDEEGPGVISLLNGRLRSQVQESNNNSKKDHKQLLSTRSAAMGVRGTDYIVAHNGVNNVTSLITLKGEVEMAKIDEAYIRQVEKSFQATREARVETFNHERNVEVRELQKARLKARGRLKVALYSKEVSKVGAGHYSGTIDGFNNVSSPVRIAPEQFLALYKNRDFSENLSETNLISSKNFVLPKELKYASSDVPPLGLMDKKNKIYAPKSGGLVDLDTSLYVPPSKDAAFHEGYNLFVSNQVGSINAETGYYLPPRGLHLHPVDGFVVDDNYASALVKSERENLGKQSKNLNQELVSQFVVGDEDKKTEVHSPGTYSSRELITKNILEISLQSYEQSVSYNSQGPGSYFQSDVPQIDLSMSHSSGRNWQLITGLSFKDVSYNAADVSQDRSALFGLQLGARYYLNSRINLVSDIRLEQDHFVENIEGIDTLSPVNSARLSLAFEWQAIRSSKWGLNLDGRAVRLMSKETRNIETQGAFGVEIKLYAHYWFSRHDLFEFGPRFYKVDQDQIDSGSTTSLERDENGLVFSYKRVF